jgi:hypothetical protein
VANSRPDPVTVGVTADPAKISRAFVSATRICSNTRSELIDASFTLICAFESSVAFIRSSSARPSSARPNTNSSCATASRESGTTAASGRPSWSSRLTRFT